MQIQKKNWDRQAPIVYPRIRQPQSHLSTSMSRLAELPPEILEQTFLNLPGQDIIKIGAVRRVATNSTRLRADFSTPRSRQTDNSRTWFVVHQNFSISGNSSPLV